jgi:hypothetical protein
MTGTIGTALGVVLWLALFAATTAVVPLYFGALFVTGLPHMSRSTRHRALQQILSICHHVGLFWMQAPITASMLAIRALPL